MKTVQRMLACLILIAVAPMAQAQVLDQIPKGSLVVVKIAHVGPTSDKLTAFFQTRGFANLLGDMAQPLDAAMKQLGIKQGLDRTGDLAMAITDDGKPGFAGTQLVLLVPVSDYKTFLGNFPNPSQEDGLDVLPMAGNPQPMFSASWGKYAAICQAKSGLQDKPRGVTLQGAAAKLISQADIAVWVDGQASAKKFQPFLDTRRAMLPQIVANMPNNNSKMAPVLTAYIGEVFDGFSRVLADGQAHALALNIGADDIRATMLSEYVPDSYMAKLVSSFKGSDQTMLDGLPAGDYIACGGVTIDSDATGPWLNDILSPIETAAKDCGDDGQKLISALEGMKQTMAAQKSASFEMTAGPSPSIISIVGGDAAAIKTGMANSVQASNDISQLMSTKGGGQTHITVKPDARTVGGISFDSVTTTMDNLDPNAAEMLKSLPGPLGDLMQLAMSPNGSTAYVGVIDAGHFISATNVSDDALAAVVKDVRAGNAALAGDKALVSTAAELPKSRLMVFYVRRPGAPVDEPPMGIAISTEGNAVRTDMEIPGPMSGAMVQGIISLMQNFTGGGAAAPANNGQPNQPPPPIPGGGL